MSNVLDRLKRYTGGPAITVFGAAVVAGVTALLGGPEWLIVLASIVSAAGALWGAIRGAESAEEVADLNRYIAGAVVGGDSFCYVSFDVPYLAATNTAQMPLHRDLVGAVALASIRAG